MSAENSKFIPSSELQKDMFCIHLDEKNGISLSRYYANVDLYPNLTEKGHRYHQKPSFDADLPGPVTLWRPKSPQVYKLLYNAAVYLTNV